MIKKMMRVDLKEIPSWAKSMPKLHWHTSNKKSFKVKRNERDDELAEYVIQAGKIRGIIEGLSELQCDGSVAIKIAEKDLSIIAYLNAYSPHIKTILEILLREIESAAHYLVSLPSTECHLEAILNQKLTFVK